MGQCIFEYTKLILECLFAIGKTLVLFLIGAVKACLPSNVLPRKSVSGEVILITGAGSGLGRLLAIEFAKLKAKLVLWDLNAVENENTAKLCRELGAVAHSYPVNVTDRKAVYDTAKRVQSDVGQVYMVINNAGIVGAGPLLKISDEAILRTMDVNVMAHFWVLKAFLPSMIESDRGHIVSIASSAGLVGLNNLAEYSTSKAAAIALSEAVAMENFTAKRDDKVEVTIVCPYYMDTGMFDGARTRFPIFLPILKPEYVCEKTVEAILTGQKVLYMPRMIYVLAFLKGILPVDAAFVLAEFFGITKSMNEFKGRAGKKEW